MITRQKIMDEIKKMRGWPMTADNVATLANMMYVCKHMEEYEGEHDEEKHHKRNEKDIEHLFHEFMKQYDSDR